MAIYDMHCHLDFAENAKDVARDAAESGIAALCSTVMPSSYVAAREKFKPYGNITVALGMHPWWVADGRATEADVNRFARLAQTTRFIGEIGLDFHRKRAGTRPRQLAVLDRVLDALDDAADRKLVFLHAVKAADVLLDALSAHGTAMRHTCAFHWFQGTHDDFGRALTADCRFSVGRCMMATPAGAAFAKAVPLERLLIETDGPAHAGAAWSADGWRDELQATLRDLARIREVDERELADALARNSEALLAA